MTIVIEFDFKREARIRDVARQVLGEGSAPEFVREFARGFRARLDGEPAPSYVDRFGVMRRAGWDAAEVAAENERGGGAW